MKVGTLFSGIGAPEMALRSGNIPHTIEFACDNDPFVKETYLSNYKCKRYYDDVNKITNPALLDLLIFGFPCQPFSIAGRGGGMTDERGKLVLKALDVVKKSRPRAFIAENVERLVSMDNGRILQSLLRKMKKLGYKTEHTLINSLDSGIPQSRRRLWIVGLRDGEFTFSDKIKPYKPLSDFLDTNADQRFFATSAFLKKTKVKQRIENYQNDFINCITQTICRNGSSSEYISYVAAVFHAIGQTRKPTVKECCRLFGFPDDFVFPDSVCTTRRYAMLANSMVVPTVKNVIEDAICHQKNL